MAKLVLCWEREKLEMKGIDMLVYRPYKTEDLDRCTEIAVDAWPIASIIEENGQSHSVMKAYVELSMLLSDYKDVCCYQDTVVGFIFCSKHKQLPTLKDRLSYNRLLWGFITGRYGKIKRRARFLFNLILTMIKVELLCRRFDCEVVLFAVDSRYRGSGIGKTLLNRFISGITGSNHKTVYLYTDIESNWNFYEHYGFKKYKDFIDNELSFIKKRKITSFIYYYEL